MYVEFSNQCNVQFVPQHDDEGTYELIFVVRVYFLVIGWRTQVFFGFVGERGP